MAPPRRADAARALQARGQLGRVAAGPGRQFAGELGQLVREPLAQARGGHLADAADRELDRQIHGQPARRARTARLERLLEALQRTVAALQRPRPRAEGAEQRQRHRLGLGRGQLDERPHGQR